MDFPDIAVPGSGQLHARAVTSLGTIVMRLEEDRAPNTVKNFAGLATGAIDWKDPKTGQPMRGTPLYDGTRFHRVIPGFMIQAGDPFSRYPDQTSRWGTGGPGYRFADEFHPELRHSGPGVLAMANAGPGTNGSQWFITEVATPFLDDKHTVFGQVVTGQDIVNKIANVPATRDRPNSDVVLQKVELFRP
ncbi:peptidyl-prolyl cis-trans isomerase [Streptomyces sp. WAC 06725]|uniref:peptidylprolyl isomerase n=1 Tax=Streptomyces sp. WAC 06725 TaxID=2203209 RepID=UPI000F7497F2|nr:peptidylprolyl isomerase [Streptomyces sp. WAC 06725]RSO42033.1 peptidyl-prolyl cis-trans isomerase [Streptomyces sp. WAC 06725]